VTVIPFYGADDPAMFTLERAAMDRDGVVVQELDAAPAGCSASTSATGASRVR
jgi:hypothetical protein